MTKTIETVVFLSLVLDLFAFTIPLPLFPRLIEWYTKREVSDPRGFLSCTLWTVQSIRSWLYNPKENSQRWDIVLLGGLMGSMFSTLQFIISPRIGALSDRYGRKSILLLTMIGNILSALVWTMSSCFASFMLARAIGGISEGNVQLAIAILSDITTPAARARALSLVGIAFSICFCIGPPIGAYFSTRPAPSSISIFGKSIELNIYAMPALLTVALLSIETVFLWVALPETRGTKIKFEDIDDDPTSGTHANGNGHAKGNGHANGHAVQSRAGDVKSRIALLRTLRWTHFLFLGLFSGVEFTITFLTFDLFDWSNSQNGRLIGFIGIISALLQGGYVRRSIPKVGEGAMARNGVASCAIALCLLAMLPAFVQTSFASKLLYLAAGFMAFTSATVVTALTAYASVQCDDAVDPDTGKAVVEHPELAKGKALGEFRSAGQLGRAIGPLLACASYWTVGPAITYGVTAAAMALLTANMRSIARRSKSK